MTLITPLDEDAAAADDTIRTSGTLAAIFATALLGPAAVVLLWTLGVRPLAGAAVVAFAAAAASVAMRARVAAAFAAVRAAFGPVAVAAAISALAVATFYQARLSVFVIDPARSDMSVLPDRKFFREHSCLSSYTEAVRFAAAGQNIYALQRYLDEPKPGEFRERYLGPLAVDIYQYPPGFLLLPAVPHALGVDFFRSRALWFAAQSALWLLALTMTAQWIGGRPGLALLLLVPYLWLAPTIRLTLQLGNFQITAFALAMIAMVAFERFRHAAGGLALAFVTISKIFPGVLGLVLLGARRWSAVVWSAGAGAALTAIAWLAVGSGPFVDFFAFQLPRIQSGEAFFWIEEPPMAPVNQSVYGLVTKLRLLGLPWTGPQAANAASSAYAGVIFAMALYAGWRLRALHQRGGTTSATIRLRSAQVWLALLSLASFRSPFVPDAYGMIGTLWLLALLAVERTRSVPAWAAFAAAAVALSIVLDGGLVPDPVPMWMVAVSLAIQVGALALNSWVAVRRAGPAPSADG